MQPDYREILYDVADGIATITLNRPEKLNAWTMRLGAEVRHAAFRADRDAAVRAIVVTGAGKGYCAGADMDMLQGIQRGSVEAAGDDLDVELAPSLPALFRGEYSYPLGLTKPVIAAVNGGSGGARRLLHPLLRPALRFRSPAAGLHVPASRARGRARERVDPAAPGRHGQRLRSPLLRPAGSRRGGAGDGAREPRRAARRVVADGVRLRAPARHDVLAALPSNHEAAALGRPVRRSRGVDPGGRCGDDRIVRLGGLPRRGRVVRRATSAAVHGSLSAAPFLASGSSPFFFPRVGAIPEARRRRAALNDGQRGPRAEANRGLTTIGVRSGARSGGCYRRRCHRGPPEGGTACLQMALAVAQWASGGTPRGRATPARRQPAFGSHGLLGSVMRASRHARRRLVAISW